MSEEAKPTELLPLVTDIVAAHLSNNNVPSAELPQLIRDVYHALAAASGGGPAPPAPAQAGGPAKKAGGPAGPARGGSAREEVGDPRLHRLPGGRQEAEDAEAPSAHGL